LPSTGVQIAYFAIIGTQLSMIALSIILLLGIYKVSVCTDFNLVLPFLEENTYVHHED
jgi:hypothetical protein